MAFLLRDIESFLKAHDMTPTRFGREACKDPRFVGDLRMGRIPGERLENRVRAWMKEYK